MKPLKILNTIKELTEWLDSVKELQLYGAGHYLNAFLDGVAQLNKSYDKKIKYIMVSNTGNNPQQIRNIPVIDYQSAELKPGDYVLLTLGHRFTDEICHLFKDTGVTVVQMDFNMFQEIPYREVKESIQPFIDHFPDKLSGLNQLVTDVPVTAWTCWWQGEEHAPEIIKICLESQRRNIPSGVKHVVITEANYKDYVTVPDYILEKVKQGKISPAHMADIIRSALLYKYGGFWMDAALFICKPLDREILDYAIYTRSLRETQFCSNAMWTISFLYAKPGNQLFLFVMEGFFYYFSVYETIQHYFMMDYMIAIMCNMYPEVENQLKKIPYNNEKAYELLKHLNEKFDEKKYEEYIEGTCVQKLTYKLGISEAYGKEDTIYGHLIKCLRGNQIDNRFGKINQGNPKGPAAMV